MNISGYDGRGLPNGLTPLYPVIIFLALVRGMFTEILSEI